MKILQITNLHRWRGGADVMAERTAAILSDWGHEVRLLTRDSRCLGARAWGKARAFAMGIYSPSGRALVRAALHDHRPDVVHVHEVYPLFSPWVLRDCRQAGVPLVMTCHDYRLTCPVATHLCGSTLCDACTGGHEYHCLLRNCRHNLLESLAYASRAYVARRLKLFSQHINMYIVPTAFVRNRLEASGIVSERIVTIANAIPLPHSSSPPRKEGYALYVGRMSSEKGVPILLEATRRAGINLKLVGDYSALPELTRNAPRSATFLGQVQGEELARLYQEACFLIFPSIWHETFGLVAAEAMSYGTPVVASNIGGIPEVVGAGGLLCRPGDAQDLAEKMTLLWRDADLCRRLGEAARRKATSEYAPETYYEALMTVYERVIGGQREYASVPLR